MYQTQKTVNDEVVFKSRDLPSIKVAEYILKELASTDDNIGVIDKSGQLVNIARKAVIWTPGEAGVIFTDKSGQVVRIEIKIV
jgi:hypothetical protein